MTRRAWFAAIFLAAAPVAYCSDSVRIVDVGLKGYYQQDSPTPVRLLVLHRDPHPASVLIRIGVHSFPGQRFERVDTFSKRLELGPNDQRIVDVPVLISVFEKARAEIDELDGGGKVLAHDEAPLEPPLSGNLIAILCSEPDICQ